VGLAAEHEGGTDGRDEAFAAWRGFLELLAEERPLVVVLEDLHWADEAMLDFVDHLVEWAGGVPMLVVCTARPELLERRPGWGGGKSNALTLSLSPLSDDDTARLIGDLLARPVLPAETQRALLARAGGNPLYAEQFARVLEEGGEEEWPLPETVQGLIAARLDLLAREEKALLQDAAVLGKVFWAGALSSLASHEQGALEARLHALERKQFVARERQSAVAGEDEYSFRHLLVRDVAYGQILARSGPLSTGRRPSGSVRSAVPRTRPRRSPTTIWQRSSSAARRGRRPGRSRRMRASPSATRATGLLRWTPSPRPRGSTGRRSSCGRPTMSNDPVSFSRTAARSSQGTKDSRSCRGS